MIDYRLWSRRPRIDMRNIEEKNMKGTVIHSRGHYRRFLEGRNSMGQLAVKAIMPTPQPETGPMQLQSRPIYFVFYCDGKSFAGSRRVVLTRGRRYPNVEHWFILPTDTEQQRHVFLVNQSAMQTFTVEVSSVSAPE